MRRSLTPAILLVPLLAIFLGHLADTEALLATRDLPRFHLPLLTALREAAQQGLPSWNPGIHGGQPILSNPNYAAFYPPTWLIAFVPVSFAISLLILVHAAIGFFGSYRFARHLGCSTGPALMAGIGFAFGGSVLGTTDLLTTFCCLAWAPWILYGCQRWFEARSRSWFSARAMLPAIAFSLQILAGQPIVVVMTGLSAAALAVFSGESPTLKIKRLAIVCMIAVPLTAVQLVPTYLRVGETPRAGGLQATTALAWSTSPWRLVETVWPRAWGDPARMNEDLYFGWSLHHRQFPYLVSIYCGQLIFVFALGAVIRWRIRHWLAWLTMIGGGVFLALGANNPAFRWLAPTLPFLLHNRYPEKFLLLTTTALVFAAALGWQKILDARKQDGPALEDFPLAIAVLITSVNAVFLLLLWQRPEVGEWFARTRLPLPPGAERLDQALDFYRSEILAAIVVSLSTVAVFGLHRWRRVAQRFLVPLTLAVLVADLYYYNHSLTPTVPVADVLTPPAKLAAVQDISGRIFTERSLLGAPLVIFRTSRPGPATIWNHVDNADPYLATVWGFEYAIHPDFDLMTTHSAQVALAALETTLGDPQAAQRLLGAWNVRHLVAARPVPEILEDRLAGSSDSSQIIVSQNPDYRDRYRFEEGVTFHAALDEALAADRADDFRAAHWVSPSTVAPRAEAEVSAEVLQVQEDYAHTKLVYRSDGTGLAPLTIARTHHAGWRAGVDGRATTVYQTSLGMMGILVPPGEHSVELRFREPATLPSAVVSFVAWIGLVSAAVVSVVRPAAG